MNCREARSLLNGFVDGVLPQFEEFAVEEHLRTCTHCRQEEMRLTMLLEKAQSLPRNIAPPSDLWPNIQERIGRQEPKDEVLLVRRYYAPMVAAALLLLLLGTGIGFWLANSVAKPGPAGVAEVKTTHDAIRACTQARDLLLKELDRQKDALSPDVLAVVQGNLRVIDGAITEITFALQEDPQNERLQNMLLASYQKQVELLTQIISVARSA